LLIEAVKIITIETYICIEYIVIPLLSNRKSTNSTEKSVPGSW
jgi:hypothetical protein